MSQRKSTYLYHPNSGIARKGGGKEGVGHDSNNYSFRSRLKLSQSMKTELALQR
jgi:hypothetical protein